MTVAICSDGDRCEPHALGEVGADEKCPMACDVPGCRIEVVDDSFCAGHLALDRAGAPIEEMVEAAKKADLYGVSLDRLLREAVRMVPLQPEVDRQR